MFEEEDSFWEFWNNVSVGWLHRDDFGFYWTAVLGIHFLYFVGACDHWALWVSFFLGLSFRFVEHIQPQLHECPGSGFLEAGWCSKRKKSVHIPRIHVDSRQVRWRPLSESMVLRISLSQSYDLVIQNWSLFQSAVTPPWARWVSSDLGSWAGLGLIVRWVGGLLSVSAVARWVLVGVPVLWGPWVVSDADTVTTAVKSSLPQDRWAGRERLLYVSWARHSAHLLFGPPP